MPPKPEVVLTRPIREDDPDFEAKAADVVGLYSESKGKEIHIVLDNLSTHKPRRVQQFLADHPKVHLHSHPRIRRG